MALGPYCEALGIDEEVLSGQKSIVCDIKDFTNGVVWELRKYQVSKNLPLKDLVDWVICICALTCENEAIQSGIGEKLYKMADLHELFTKSNCLEEVDRLMKWQFDFPNSTGIEPPPLFVPVVHVSAKSDSNMSHLDGDNEEVKSYKGQEEPVQLEEKREKVGSDNEAMDIFVKDEEAKKCEAHERSFQVEKKEEVSIDVIIDMSALDGEVTNSKVGGESFHLEKREKEGSDESLNVSAVHYDEAERCEAQEKPVQLEIKEKTGSDGESMKMSALADGDEAKCHEIREKLVHLEEREKDGKDNDDSMDMSGLNDEQAKRRKSHEELVQLKKDLMSARKNVLGLNERFTELSKQCAHLIDVSKSSVSECKKIENAVSKLRTDWNDTIITWHDCIERLNYVNNNKGNYLNVGYMVRRNKTKQGIFDELNFEFERTVDEFKHRIVSIVEKERRKKRSVSREYRQKGRSRKRVSQDNESEAEESKKQRLSEEISPKQDYNLHMPVEEFVKSEKVDEFMGGKFVSALKAIYIDLISLPIPCKNVHEVVFTVLDTLEELSVEKIPSQSFAGNILMETRMLAMLRAFDDLIRKSKVNICNNSVTKFTLVESSYDVTLPDDTHMLLGVRTVCNGSPDTSLDLLNSICTDLINSKADNATMETVAEIIKTFVIDPRLLERNLIEIVFLCKQQVLPKIKYHSDKMSETCYMKVATLSNFCVNLYFLWGLAKLLDAITVSWELDSNTDKTSLFTGTSYVLSNTIQHIQLFCQALDPITMNDSGKEFVNFLRVEKKLETIPLAPYKGNICNIIFHNCAGVWFCYETGFASEFLEKMKDKVDGSFSFLNDKYSMAIVRSLGLIGKLVAVPIWTSLESIDTDTRYREVLKKCELWSKDASSFMKGQERLFDDIPVSLDAVYISLIKNNETTDALTKELLELIFTALVSYVECFLYGGNMNGGASTNVKSDLSSVVLKDSVIFDNITKSIHSLPKFVLDALTNFSKTGNGEWQDKFGSKGLSMLKLIQKNSNKQLKLLYERKIRLSQIQEQRMEQKEKLSKCRRIEKMYKLTDDIVKWGGLWKSEKEMDVRLRDMKENDRLKALKAQIQFRRQALCEVHENKLLDLALDGECFNAEKLHENLVSILRYEYQLTETDVFELASATEDQERKTEIFQLCTSAVEILDDVDCSKSFALNENFCWLMGKLISHTFMVGGNLESVIGVCIARKKVEGIYFYFMRYEENIFKFSENKIAYDYKNGQLCVIDPSAKDLIGTRLSRAFFKDNGDLVWYDCRAIEMVGAGPEFVVEFDYYGNCLLDNAGIPEVEGLTFSSRLLEDYEADRLRLL